MWAIINNVLDNINCRIYSLDFPKNKYKISKEELKKTFTNTIYTPGWRW